MKKPTRRRLKDLVFDVSVDALYDLPGTLVSVEDDGLRFVVRIPGRTNLTLEPIKPRQSFHDWAEQVFDAVYEHAHTEPVLAP